MAVFDSPATTYSDTTPHRRVITDVISLIDPSDTPAIDALGGLDGASSKFRFVNTPGKVVEWLEDTLLPLSDTLNGSIATNTTAVTVTDASAFQEGHIILVDAEQMWVSATVNSTEVLTVTRNYGGTQATHASAATVTIVGMARLEGADSDDIAFTDRSTNSNFTQILHQEVKVTGSHQVLSQYGIADEMEYQAMKIVPTLNRLLERGLYYGQRKTGSATTPRAFGGLGTFITDNTVSAGGAITQAHFENALKAAYSDGGSGPWTAFCSPNNMQVIKNFYDSSAFLRVTRDESTVGMVIHDVITPFGQVSLVMDRWAPSASVYIVDPNHAGFLTYRPYAREPLAKTGDADKEEVVGEFTLCVRQDKAHAVVTAIS